MTFLATLLGFTLARMADPLLLILAFIFGRKIESRGLIFLIALGYAVISTVVFEMLDSVPAPANVWPKLIAGGSLAALFWFYVFYAVAAHKRRRNEESIDEVFD